jgi:pSer/pThr/pTyr-binding forkhead associated (FHA) protein
VPENLLQLLKLCFLALLYLFFLRVVWSVWQQVRTPPAPNAARAVATAPPPPAPAPPPKRKHGKQPSGPPSVLDVVQPSNRAGASFAVGEELTIGRASGCAVSLGDDTYVSQLHARVYQRDGIVFLEDLGSTNGTFLNGQRVQAPTAIHSGDRMQIGSTILEAR